MRLSPASILSIGLTGGIGSGKSTVAQYLLACGATLVDTDAIARSLTAPAGAALPALAAAFGADIFGADGALARERMRAIVFSDPTAKGRLEAILHPMIGVEAARQAQAAGRRPVVFDEPLLAESRHWRTRVDRILVVDCPQQTQIDRVMQRSGWPRDAVLQVIEQQATGQARRAIADAVIFNGRNDLQLLHREILSLWQLWLPAGPVEQSRAA